MSSVLSQLNVSNQSFNEKRDKAIEDMWKTILDLQEIYNIVERLENTINFQKTKEGPLDNYLLPNKDALQQKYVRKWMDELDLDEDNWVEKIVEKIEEKISLISDYRIFLGEQIWWLFYMYSSFIKETFLAIYVESFFKRTIEEWVEGWVKDKSIIKILEKVFTEDELLQINWGSLGAVSRARIMFESKIVREVNKVFSGEKAAELGFKTAQRYAKVVQELFASENKPKSKYKNALSRQRGF